jgi:putative DNA primase/helicase
VYTSEETQTRAGFLVVRPENIPEVLRSYDHWVLWRAVRSGKRWTKVLYEATNPACKANVRDSRTWSPFEECLLRYESESSCHGVGFVFGSGDTLAGVDLDECRDRESGALQPWAEQRLETARALGAYCELSPSGTGVHLIGHCEKLVEGGNRKPLELYTHARFFTVTGWVL